MILTEGLFSGIRNGFKQIRMQKRSPETSTVLPSKIGHLFAEKREIHIEKNVFLKVFKASWVAQGGYYTMQKCFLHFCIV